MRTCLVLLAVLSFSGVAAAQSGVCSESAVKAAKAAAGTGALPYTSDHYFFSGALDKPVIGTAAAKQAGSAVAARRKNESQTAKTDRIVADDSGSMAYEYGTVHISFADVKTGGHEDFTSAYLRVWKADGGECKVAAEMAEPENNTKQGAKN
jgi:hypothetical protein